MYLSVLCVWREWRHVGKHVVVCVCGKASLGRNARMWFNLYVVQSSFVVVKCGGKGWEWVGWLLGYRRSYFVAWYMATPLTVAIAPMLDQFMMCPPTEGLSRHIIAAAFLVPIITPCFKLCCVRWRCCLRAVWKRCFAWREGARVITGESKTSIRICASNVQNTHTHTHTHTLLRVVERLRHACQSP